MHERKVTLVMCWIWPTALYIKLSHTQNNLKETEHPKPRVVFNETLKQEVDRISLHNKDETSSVGHYVLLAQPCHSLHRRHDPLRPRFANPTFPPLCLHLSTITEH